MKIVLLVVHASIGRDGVIVLFSPFQKGLADFGMIVTKRVAQTIFGAICTRTSGALVARTFFKFFE